MNTVDALADWLTEKSACSARVGRRLSLWPLPHRDSKETPIAACLMSGGRKLGKRSVPFWEARARATSASVELPKAETVELPQTDNVQLKPGHESPTVLVRAASKAHRRRHSTSRELRPHPRSVTITLESSPSAMKHVSPVIPVRENSKTHRRRHTTSRELRLYRRPVTQMLESIDNRPAIRVDVSPALIKGEGSKSCPRREVMSRGLQSYSRSSARSSESADSLSARMLRCRQHRSCFDVVVRKFPIEALELPNYSPQRQSAERCDHDGQLSSGPFTRFPAFEHELTVALGEICMSA